MIPGRRTALPCLMLAAACASAAAASLDTIVKENWYASDAAKALLLQERKDLARLLPLLDPYGLVIPPERARRGLGGVEFALGRQRLVYPLPGGGLEQAGVEQPFFLLNPDAARSDSKVVTVEGRWPDSSESWTRQVRVEPITAPDMILDAGQRTLTLFRIDARSTRAVINRLSARLADGFTLDLRYCQGGDLYETIDILSDWLPEDNKVAELIAANGEEYEYFTQKTGNRLPAPGVILQSELTASACEVLAGALTAYLEVPVAGAPSYGKCWSQQEFMLDDGNRLHLTTHYYSYAPDFECRGAGIPVNKIIPASQRFLPAAALKELPQRED
ncbi:peptidase family S41 protein [Hahella chejuensis KCTC 2396]|uniref:Peptidase family S41 protein n=1 Tax=Hahella chejuensis (strain KCTC 2396) TaxID=349521 RepID=Q2SIF4_HAHCH|nr:S41 family peptidase [Hahella chejuensis]ABC29570.1 peptidase family S41 protein [Hahella chejuensis KCTC 2396]